MDSDETTPSWPPDSAPTSMAIMASISFISRARTEEGAKELISVVCATVDEELLLCVEERNGRCNIWVDDGGGGSS